MLYSISKILDHNCYHYSEFFFRYSAYFVYIYLVLWVLSSLLCSIFSVVSFCLTYCVYGLFSTSCRLDIPLASVVSTMVGEVGPAVCVGFLVVETGV